MRGTIVDNIKAEQKTLELDPFIKFVLSVTAIATIGIMSWTSVNIMSMSTDIAQLRTQTELFIEYGHGDVVRRQYEQGRSIERHQANIDILLMEMQRRERLSEQANHQQ